MVCGVLVPLFQFIISLFPSPFWKSLVIPFSMLLFITSSWSQDSIFPLYHYDSVGMMKKMHRSREYSLLIHVNIYIYIYKPTLIIFIVCSKGSFLEFSQFVSILAWDSTYLNGLEPWTKSVKVGKQTLNRFFFFYISHTYSKYFLSKIYPEENVNSIKQASVHIFSTWICVILINPKQKILMKKIIYIRT